MVSLKPFIVLFIVGLYGDHRSGLADAQAWSARGIRLPPRREIISLRDFRAKVADTKWYQLYFGSTLTSVFLNGEFEFVPKELTPQIAVKVKADVPGNGSSVQCVTEADFGSPVLIPFENSLKAEFTSNSGAYWSFFGSDLDSYLLNIECTSGRPFLRCPVSDTFLSIYVKSLRPDSVPLHRALRDLWRVSGVTLDVDPEAFPFVFTLGKNTCSSVL